MVKLKYTHLLLYKWVLVPVLKKCTEFSEMFFKFLVLENTHECLLAQENNFKDIIIEI